MSPRHVPDNAPKVDERTARLAYIAGRMHGIPVARIPAWANEEFQLELSKRRLQDAIGPVRRRSPYKKTPGRKGASRIVRQQPIIQDGVLVDEPALGLIRVLFRLANEGWTQGDLLVALETVPGIRQIIEVDSTRELIVIALAPSMDDADDLRARIEELAPGRPVRRDIISFESHRPAPATWRKLAGDVASSPET